jgi:hypothetical protein
MKSRPIPRLVLAAMFAAGFACAQQASGASGVAAFHVETTLATVPFQVSRGGRFVTDLKAADVILLEDGKARGFTLFQGPPDRSSAELALLFDTTTWPMGLGWNPKRIYDFISRWDEESSRQVLAGDIEFLASVYHFDGVQLERLCRSTRDPKEVANAIRKIVDSIHGELTANQQRGIANALAASPNDKVLQQLSRTDFRAAAPNGDNIPLDLPPGRDLVPPEGWPGTGHRGWPFEAALATLGDAASASRNSYHILVMFSPGIGGTTTSADDVATLAITLGIPIYPVAFRIARSGIFSSGRDGGGRAEARERVSGPEEDFYELGAQTGGRAFEASLALAGDRTFGSVREASAAHDTGGSSDLTLKKVREILEVAKREGLARARSQFTVGFAADSSATPREHVLEVKLAAKSGPKLTGGKRRIVY